MKFGGIRLGLLLLIVASSCSAQTQDNSTTPAKTDKPAAAAAPAASAPAPEKKKPKKVWTNEEIGSVGGTISVVGESSAPSSAPATKKPVTQSDQARQNQIVQYRSEIQEIQVQMDSIDKRIAQLHNFKAENTTPSGGINPYQGYNMVPVEEQVKQLEDKKKKLQSKIDDIEVEARKNGIDSGDLR